MIERTSLAPGYNISRIIKGGWQLSAGHSDSVSSDPVQDMRAFVDAGIDTFDCADIYTGVEELIGSFIAEQRVIGAPLPRVHTKCVPDYDALATLRREDVTAIVDRSLQRLGVDRLDMVQFHWWNYAVPRWLEAASWLRDLRDAGKIELLGLTNFNTAHTKAILEAGLPLASTQVQYSLLDPRPEKALVGLCREHGIQLLCYGTLAGGFLSERWLGRSRPHRLENRSLVKYQLMIEEVGGWELFQQLLATLKRIADRHHTTVAAIASRWVLEQPAVAAVIIGSRNATHLPRYAEVFRVALTQQDLDEIESLRQEMHEPPQDVFDLERNRSGRHGRIMKYNLNAE
jgi:aryl-alcohol dehydrogenase-like predicted oxidoreductase